MLGPPSNGEAMSERAFFQPESRSAVRSAIEHVESQTSAELVVAVRRQSDSYRHVDCLVGAVTAYAVLLMLLFHPAPFEVAWMPVEVALAFALGAFASSSYWGLKRLFVPGGRKHTACWRAACAWFHEKGITRTSGRNGVLVYVSMLERRVEVVTDIGIDVDALGPGWQSAVQGIRAAVERGPDLARFVEALKALGPVLGAAMPHAADDVNELPDEPDVS
jgi:putative membrane protein